MGAVATEIERVVREERRQLLATVVRIVRDLQTAEDVVQDAVVAALRTWPEQGIPDRPGAWLLVTARRRALDRTRARVRNEARVGALRQYEAGLQRFADPDAVVESIPDDQLRLMFVCCHPSLSPTSQVALTLRHVAGSSTEAIARSFLVPIPTMAQRLTRAKQTLRDAPDPLEEPPPGERASRLEAVMRVIYLTFHEGYTNPGREDDGPSLVEEALRLAALLVRLTERREPEALGLLALLRIQASRTLSRVDDRGELVLIQHQDRSQWDRALANQGCRDLTEALQQGRPGSYQLQAAIAACHAEAPTWPDTDWPQIVALYDALMAVEPSPVVALNRAVAVGIAEGPDRGLAETEALAEFAGMQRYHLWHACRADWLRRLGRLEQARLAYERALSLTDNDREQVFLRSRLEECRLD
ncbi:MAG: sigma-70 family RNA polymerase sigma factor [Myxococcota bacterium]